MLAPNLPPIAAAGGPAPDLSHGPAAALHAISGLTPPPLGAVARAVSANGQVLAPVLILVLCVVAGLGTFMLLPGRKESVIRKMGGVILLACGLILGAVLVRYANARAGGAGVYFWIFSFVALAGAVRVVTHPRPVYSALYFVLTVFASAGLFVLLWAEFMAAALVLIYAGAILVTYVFVIMLASQAASPEAEAGAETARQNAGSAPRGLAPVTEYDAVSREPVVAAALGFALMGVLLFVIFDRANGLTPNPRPPQAVPYVVSTGATQQLGLHLFQEHMLNLELAGLILTVSMVGAIIIARRRIVGADAPGTAAAGEVMVGLATPVDDNPHSIPVYGTDNPRQKAYPET